MDMALDIAHAAGFSTAGFGNIFSIFAIQQAIVVAAIIGRIIATWGPEDRAQNALAHDAIRGIAIAGRGYELATQCGIAIFCTPKFRVVIMTNREKIFGSTFIVQHCDNALAFAIEVVALGARRDVHLAVITGDQHRVGYANRRGFLIKKRQLSRERFFTPEEAVRISNAKMRLHHHIPFVFAWPIGVVDFYDCRIGENALFRGGRDGCFTHSVGLYLPALVHGGDGSIGAFPGDILVVCRWRGNGGGQCSSTSRGQNEGFRRHGYARYEDDALP
jgi:hypothetical protein